MFINKNYYIKIGISLFFILLFSNIYILPVEAASPPYQYGQQCYDSGVFVDDCDSGLTCQSSNLPSKTNPGTFKFFCSCKNATMCDEKFGGPGAGNKWVCTKENADKVSLGLSYCGTLSIDGIGSIYPKFPVYPPADFDVVLGTYYGRCICDVTDPTKAVKILTKNGVSASCNNTKCTTAIGKSNNNIMPKNNSDCQKYATDYKYSSCVYSPVIDVKQDYVNGLNCSEVGNIDTIICDGKSYIKSDGDCTATADCKLKEDGFCFTGKCRYTCDAGTVGTFPNCKLPSVEVPIPAEEKKYCCDCKAKGKSAKTVSFTVESEAKCSECNVSPTPGECVDVMLNLEKKASSVLNKAGYLPGKKGFIQIVGKAIMFLLFPIGAFMMGFYIWAGLLWMTASGKTENIEKAKAIIVWTTLGLVASLASYMIVDFFFKALF